VIIGTLRSPGRSPPRNIGRSIALSPERSPSLEPFDNSLKRSPLGAFEDQVLPEAS